MSSYVSVSEAFTNVWVACASVCETYAKSMSSAWAACSELSLYPCTRHRLQWRCWCAFHTLALVTTFMPPYEKRTWPMSNVPLASLQRIQRMPNVWVTYNSYARIRRQFLNMLKIFWRPRRMRTYTDVCQRAWNVYDLCLTYPQRISAYDTVWPIFLIRTHTLLGYAIVWQGFKSKNTAGATGQYGWSFIFWLLCNLASYDLDFSVCPLTSVTSEGTNVASIS